MSLYEKYKPGLDKLFTESMYQIMNEDAFYEKSKSKFAALDKEIKGLSVVNAQDILRRSAISKIQKVHNRIFLIRDLRAKIANADNLTQVFMYPGLVTYLYLTCFDQLGAPANGWRFFPNWMESQKNRKEVEEIVNESRNKFNSNNLSGIKSIAKEIYNKYHSLYGVKNSFFRFLREIIPEDIRNSLLNSILVEKWTYGDTQILDFDVDELYKEKWLYDTRNNYTHNLFTTQTNQADGKVIDGNTWMNREVILKNDGNVVIWVLDNFDSILEDTILQAIKVLIEKD
ncbi:MAG: hypothetical protein K1X55_18165 [Chitinophagales bacterium]|nr:hypothetical protein [Chitinophagales bacterium]